jgi:hypothetical protein
MGDPSDFTWPTVGATKSAEERAEHGKALVHLLANFREERGLEVNHMVTILADTLGAWAVLGRFPDSQVTAMFEKSYREALAEMRRRGLI